MHLPPISQISIPTDGNEVEHTTARLLARQLGTDQPRAFRDPGPGLRVALSGGHWKMGPVESLERRPRMWVRIQEDGTGELMASEPSLLYALAELLIDGPFPWSPERLEEGILLDASFSWQRPLFDYVYAQSARSARKFDAETYVQLLARCGFTHVEVNSLATHVPLEPGVAGEYYSQFYTYCPALNQFVDSTLTTGLYPHEYLQANLNRLKKLATLGRRYGLKPGLLCFEPRSVPESLFQRYPTLRGARVDHPFRSHMPRYTLAQDHPVTQDHYRQLVRNLLHEVPDLAYLSIWTNDSGSGFEHTASLYVGRNGGPFMIREWRSHEKIAETAGKSAVRFLRLLQETASEINPEFEVSLRIEPFKVEHDTILAGMGRGVTFEAPSLLVRGYHLPYTHSKYPDQQGAAGTIQHLTLDEVERTHLASLRERDIEPTITYAPATGFNMEPLLGIPFPRLLYTKLLAIRNLGFQRVAAHGGLLNTSATPFWPNPEVIRAVQLGVDVPLDTVLRQAAIKWAGDDHAEQLLALWDAVDEAVSYMPIIPLYSNFGFVWLRTWVRPFVPDIEAIPAGKRRYYERFLVSTANNPAINDFGRDVLFDLITQESGKTMAGQFDENVFPRLDRVFRATRNLAETTGEPARSVFVDLRDRIRALRCWSLTQRNTCAWVAGVYGYLDATMEQEKSDHLSYVQAMVTSELENARDLLNLWNTSKTEFMLVSDIGETSTLYGENFGDLLREKISLMEMYGHHLPRIDREILWRLT